MIQYPSMKWVINIHVIHCIKCLYIFIRFTLSLGSTFQARGPIKLPSQDIFTSEPPEYYKAEHMYVGATVNFNGFIFVLIDADEYALRYQEINCNQVFIRFKYFNTFIFKVYFF